MNLKIIALAGALAALGTFGNAAMAQTYALNPGTPTVTAGAPILTNASWYAEEFTLGAGQTVTSVGAFLNSIGNTGSLTFALYSGSSISTGARNPTVLQSWSTTFAGNGWNTDNVSFTSATGGTYWLAIEGTTAGQTYTAPLESGTGTGTVPALSFAYTTTGTSAKSWTVATTFPVGLEVQVASVPEPDSFALLALGLLGVVALTRRKRTRTRTD